VFGQKYCLWHYYTDFQKKREWFEHWK
jgi:hypothetical protein